MRHVHVHLDGLSNGCVLSGTLWTIARQGMVEAYIYGTWSCVVSIGCETLWCLSWTSYPWVTWKGLCPHSSFTGRGPQGYHSSFVGRGPTCYHTSFRTVFLHVWALPSLVTSNSFLYLSCALTQLSVDLF
jgi:hypothetical protein